MVGLTASNQVFTVREESNVYLEEPSTIVIAISCRDVVENTDSKKEPSSKSCKYSIWMTELSFSNHAKI